MKALSQQIESVCVTMETGVGGANVLSLCLS